MALSAHKEATKLQGKTRERELQVALAMYDAYLEVFPHAIRGSDMNYPMFMRYYQAEVLFRLDRFVEAGERFEQVIAMAPQPHEPRERELVIAAVEEAITSQGPPPAQDRCPT